MAGIEVTKSVIDTRVAEAVLALRLAFDKIENVAKFLANNPNGETDPLISVYGYSADDAYLIRLVFESFESTRVNNATMFDTSRKLTGLD